MTDEIVKRHVFSFNPNDNGGENFTLLTRVFDNGEGEVYIDQELTLHSYCNSASFHLSGAAITPGVLRKLANELDVALVEAKVEAKQNLAAKGSSEDPATS